MVVREAGRQQVLREGRKNVHAFARIGAGDVTPDVGGWDTFARNLPNAVEISYNPYKAGFFYRKDNHRSVDVVKTLIMLAPVGSPPSVWATL